MLGFQNFGENRIFNNRQKTLKNRNQNVYERTLVHTCTKFQINILKKELGFDTLNIRNGHFSHYFLGLPHFLDFRIFSDFGSTKSVLRSFSAFLTKNWHTNMYHATLSELFSLNLLRPCGPEWHWPYLRWFRLKGSPTTRSHGAHSCTLVLNMLIESSVSDTIDADLLIISIWHGYSARQTKHDKL